jgi:hypothetical protein
VEADGPLVQADGPSHGPLVEVLPVGKEVLPRVWKSLHLQEGGQPHSPHSPSAARISNSSKLTSAVGSIGVSGFFVRASGVCIRHGRSRPTAEVSD